MKNNFLLGFFVFMSVGAFAQKSVLHQHKVTKQNNNTSAVVRNCGTNAPGQEWDNWFNGLVEEFKSQQSQGKMNSMPSYTVPVIIHIIHAGGNVGTGDNISQAQANSQVAVLNADYAGTGFNVSQCPSAFTSVLANTQITFCLAQKDPNGNILAEPGIHRVPYTSISGLSAPGNGYSTFTIDGTIKPNTIWDPTKYCNIWVCKLGGGLLGYATFPSGTGLTGLSGFGSATTDGVVIGYNYFGNTGSVSAPFNKGRTTTHEIGHWLGLRHINGDSNCGNDFCADTPQQDQLHYGCISSATPYHTNACGANTSPNGEMTMNFMDYTDDACMYMFTNDQKTRIQTAMANGTYRSQLTNQSITICNSTPSAPVAGFTVQGGTLCVNTAITFNNTTNGTPPVTYNWSVNPGAGVTINSPTSQNPTITFASAGSYTVTLNATNGQGSNSATQTVNISSCAGGTGGCDTISNFDFVNHTPSIYGSGGFGYASGHNDYLDKAKADFFPAGSYPTNYRVSKAIYYFAKNYDGTGGGTSVNCKVWDDNGTAGAPSTALTPSVPLPINNIDVSGAGNLITFSPAINPANGGFYVGFDGLVYNGTTGTFDTVAIVTNADGESAPVTAWEQWSDNSWHSFNDGTGATWQLDLSLCIAVIMCDPVTGQEYILNPTGQVILYPNPASGTLYINASTKKEGVMGFRIFNIMGQQLLEKNMPTNTSGNYQLELDKLSSGVYFVTVTTPEKSVTKRIVIEK